MAETQDEVFIFCKIAVQDLHRYDTIQKDVLGHIDISHTAGADLFDQLISFVKNLSYHCLLRLLLIVIGHGNLRNRRFHCGISISLKGAAQKKHGRFASVPQFSFKKCQNDRHIIPCTGGIDKLHQPMAQRVYVRLLFTGALSDHTREGIVLDHA